MVDRGLHAELPQRAPGVFGTLTGFLANAFLAPSEAVSVVDAPVAEQHPFGDSDDPEGEPA